MRRSTLITDISLALISISLVLTGQPAHSMHSVTKRASATALANPGLLVIDESDGRVVVENAPDSRRVPASVLKLLTATVALYHLGADARFSTAIWSTAKRNEFLIMGSLDPFLTSTRSNAERFGQRYLPALTNRAIPGSIKRVKIYYRNLYPRDVYSLGIILKQKKVRATFIKVDREKAMELAGTEISALTSPPLSTMVSHTILWSDNLVSDRLSNSVLRQLDYPDNASSRTSAYKEVLTTLGVSSDGLSVRDGSGLSKKNRLSARTVVELLLRIRNDDRFSSIYAGLPVAGESGTLVKRFEKAPLAIGHVHAKTGWVNRSVTMAGYAESGEKEYVFAILADEITPTLKARNQARQAMDKFLETVVKGDH